MVTTTVQYQIPGMSYKLCDRDAVTFMHGASTVNRPWFNRRRTSVDRHIVKLVFVVECPGYVYYKYRK